MYEKNTEPDNQAASRNMDSTCWVCCLKKLYQSCSLTELVTSDDQVKAYIKKIMSQLNKWMTNSKISKLVVAITSKETGETVERWQFDVSRMRLLDIFLSLANFDISCIKGTNLRKRPETSSFEGGEQASRQRKCRSRVSKDVPSNQDNLSSKRLPSGTPDATPAEKTEKEIQSEIQSIFRQVTASVTFLPQLDAGNCTFNVLVYADADSDVPMEWGDSDAKEIENGEKVQLRSFSTSNHRVDTLVSYR